MYLVRPTKYIVFQSTKNQAKAIYFDFTDDRTTTPHPVQCIRPHSCDMIITPGTRRLADCKYEVRSQQQQVCSSIRKRLPVTLLLTAWQNRCAPITTKIYPHPPSFSQQSCHLLKRRERLLVCLCGCYCVSAVGRSLKCHVHGRSVSGPKSGRGGIYLGL